MKAGFHLGEATYSKVQSDKGTILPDMHCEIQMIKSFNSIGIEG